MPKPAKRAIKPSGKKSPIVECPHCRQRVIPSKPNVCPSCLQSMEVKKGAITPAATKPSSAPPVTLYTPRQVFFLSCITGLPTGLVLASINWVRMGSTGTAVVHWVAGSLLLTLWSYSLFGSTASCGGWLGLIIQIGFCFYLYRQMSRDINAFTLQGNPNQPARWRSAFLLALVTAILIIFLVTMLLLLLIAMSSSTESAL